MCYIWFIFQSTVVLSFLKIFSSLSWNIIFFKPSKHNCFIICLILLLFCFLLMVLCAIGYFLFFAVCWSWKNCLWEFFVARDESAFLQKEFTVTRCLGNHFYFGFETSALPFPIFMQLSFCYLTLRAVRLFGSPSLIGGRGSPIFT